MISKLFSVQKEKYGESYNDHLMEQYKIYLQGVENISDRRQQTNNYFIAINTALFSIITFIASNNNLTDFFLIKVVFAGIGIIICIIFWNLIRSYKLLNNGKFSVIHEIERKLPLSLYQYEWEKLGEGKNNELYHPFSNIELLLPKVFGTVYFILMLLFLFKVI